jgi:uncharacterized protein YndB with AHSA1/START domain
VIDRGALVLAVVGICTTATVLSATVRSIDVQYDDGVYRVVSDTYVDAPREAIFEVLTDYERFGRISSAYTDYGFMKPDTDGVPIIYTTMEGCVLFFCMSMRRVERMELDAPSSIRTEALPEQSDFKLSVSEWTLVPEAGGTKMTYRLTMEPDFWIPPLIGPWVLKQRLERGGSGAINRIERLAIETAARAATAD